MPSEGKFMLSTFHMQKACTWWSGLRVLGNINITIGTLWKIPCLGEVFLDNWKIEKCSSHLICCIFPKLAEFIWSFEVKESSPRKLNFTSRKLIKALPDDSSFLCLASFCTLWFLFPFFSPSSPPFLYPHSSFISEKEDI